MRHRTPLGARRLSVVAFALLFCMACSGRESAPRVEPLDAATVAASWPVELATSEAVDEATLLAFGERWLGLAGDGGAWRPPGHPPEGLSASLTARWINDDRLAFQFLNRLDLHVQCRLGTEPGTFGSEVPEGWAAAELACAAMADEQGARRVAELRLEAGLEEAAPLPELPTGTDVASLMAPAVDRTVEVAGESLRYRFILPGQWEATHELLPWRPSTGDLASRVGTSAWLEGEIESQGSWVDVFADDLAGIEREAEIQIARWKVSLEELSATEPELDGAARSLLLGWIRRALYRDLGLYRATHSPELALPLLEEATGSEARPAPGPGLDPALLSAFAWSRYRSGEIRGAAEVLTRIAAQPGWHWVGALAEGAARVAVLPSVTASEVRR